MAMVTPIFQVVHTLGIPGVVQSYPQVVIPMPWPKLGPTKFNVGLS